jgi:hypothetical protein
VSHLSSFTSPWRGEVASRSDSEGWREGVNREANGRAAELKEHFARRPSPSREGEEVRGLA